MESRLEKLEKSENSKTDEKKKDQDEEKWCKSVIKGLARRNREKPRDIGRGWRRRPTRRVRWRRHWQRIAVA